MDDDSRIQPSGRRAEGSDQAQEAEEDEDISDVSISSLNETVEEDETKPSSATDSTLERKATPAKKPKEPKRSGKKKFFKKSPDAPKRFKSSFIFYSIQRHKEIRESISTREGRQNEQTTNIAQQISDEWRKMTPKDREPWDEVAKQDKERFEQERDAYKGPWTVLVNPKRKKKDPSAPKRGMSAFLCYAKTRRALIKQENPNLSNADVSKVLSRMWKDETSEVKQKYRDQEKEERQRYLKAMEKWRESEERKSNQGPSNPSGISSYAAADQMNLSLPTRYTNQSSLQEGATLRDDNASAAVETPMQQFGGGGGGVLPFAQHPSHQHANALGIPSPGHGVSYDLNYAQQGEAFPSQQSSSFFASYPFLQQQQLQEQMMQQFSYQQPPQQSNAGTFPPGFATNVGDLSSVQNQVGGTMGFEQDFNPLRQFSNESAAGSGLYPQQPPAGIVNPHTTTNPANFLHPSQILHILEQQQEQHDGEEDEYAMNDPDSFQR